jgi:hypothetical protein
MNSASENSLQRETGHPMKPIAARLWYNQL